MLEQIKSLICQTLKDYLHWMVLLGFTLPVLVSFALISKAMCVFFILCEPAMSVIHKVKDPLEITYLRSLL